MSMETYFAFMTILMVISGAAAIAGKIIYILKHRVKRKQRRIKKEKIFDPVQETDKMFEKWKTGGKI